MSSYHPPHHRHPRSDRDRDRDYHPRPLPQQQPPPPPTSQQPPQRSRMFGSSRPDPYARDERVSSRPVVVVSRRSGRTGWSDQVPSSSTAASSASRRLEHEYRAERKDHEAAISAQPSAPPPGRPTRRLPPVPEAKGLIQVLTEAASSIDSSSLPEGEVNLRLADQVMDSLDRLLGEKRRGRNVAAEIAEGAKGIHDQEYEEAGLDMLASNFPADGTIPFRNPRVPNINPDITLQALRKLSSVAQSPSRSP